MKVLPHYEGYLSGKYALKVNSNLKVHYIDVDQGDSTLIQIIIKAENRLKYYSALDKAHTTNNSKDFIALVIEELDKTLDIYLKYI